MIRFNGTPLVLVNTPVYLKAVEAWFPFGRQNTFSSVVNDLSRGVFPSYDPFALIERGAVVPLPDYVLEKQLAMTWYLRHFNCD
ncbi:MAG: hypothetical protein IJ228_08595 [Succinivibrio sp.]|nr:hypothetical protein [Succinivibrio sp.]